jgi:uncharacterized damage-inducible protein DinB
MTDTIDTIRRLLARELDAFVREVELVPDDDTLWKTAGGVSNSCGNLALHVSGNLQDYVGRVLGGLDYVRDRDREFSARSGSRADVVAELRRAAAAVNRTLRGLDPARLDEVFPVALGSVRPRIGVLLLHLVSHTAFHLGQTGYVRRLLTGSPATSGALPITDLAGI